jgi:hypothetical protein
MKIYFHPLTFFTKNNFSIAVFNCNNTYIGCPMDNSWAFFFNVLEYNNYGMPVQKHGRKKKKNMFQTEKLEKNFLETVVPSYYLKEMSPTNHASFSLHHVSCFVLAVLEFELRASSLLGRWSTT